MTPTLRLFVPLLAFDSHRQRMMESTVLVPPDQYRVLNQLTNFVGLHMGFVHLPVVASALRCSLWRARNTTSTRAVEAFLHLITHIVRFQLQAPVHKGHRALDVLIVNSSHCRESTSDSCTAATVAALSNTECLTITRSHIGSMCNTPT